MGTQIRFWKDPYKNEPKSKEAGVPVFDTVDWYEIRVLGEPDTVSGPWHRAPGNVREEWRAAHEQWTRDNSTEGIIGTLLSEVPWLERGEVETLKFAGIRTLENLADVADSSITRIPGGVTLRQKARDALASGKDTAHQQRMSEELAKRDTEIAELRAQIKDILAAKRAKKE